MNSIEIIKGLVLILSPFFILALGSFISKIANNSKDHSYPLNGGTF